jgi:hypothetical protein
MRDELPREIQSLIAQCEVNVTSFDNDQMSEALHFAETMADRIRKAIEVAVQFGGVDGQHHKTWVIDQMVRELAGDDYERIVADAKRGEDGPDTYSWDEGVAP